MGKTGNILDFSSEFEGIKRANPDPRYGPLRALSLMAGPGIVVAAILSAHGYDLYAHWQEYVEAPPTISGALLEPHIAGPFAIAMIISAMFLTWGVVQIAVALWHPIRGARPSFSMLPALLIAGIACELTAIVGMIVLSQFTGNVSQPLHDVGSYMLFFGHAIGISILGAVIHLHLPVFAVPDPQSIATANRFLALRKQPRRAGQIALLSVLFGVVYFGGKQLPDAYFFWQRTTMSVLEVVVIFSFLGFLVAFGPFLGFWAHDRSDNTPKVSSGRH